MVLQVKNCVKFEIRSAENSAMKRETSLLKLGALKLTPC